MPFAPIRALLLSVSALFLPSLSANAAGLTVSQVGARQVPAGLEARFTLDTLAEPQVFLLPAPQPRLVIDLPAAWIEAGGVATAQGALALSESALRVRYARRDPNTTRLVFDLPQSAKLGTMTRAFVGGSVQFSIPLVYAGPVPAREQKPREAGAVITQQAHFVLPGLATEAAPLIVLDAGHGGNDPGASGAAGEAEKTVTLAAARELRDLLQARGYRVRLTRDDDSFVSLDQRVARARAWEADLFLSLHADAAEQASTAGASVYTLSARGRSRTRDLRDAKDWVLPAKTAQISDILFDLTQHASADQSKEFSAVLQQHLRGAIPLVTNSQRSANFYVLLAPDVPAVLLEMGFITNSVDAQRLGTATGRESMLQAIAAAIDAHFATPTLLAARD